jgi:hypothetical protein
LTHDHKLQASNPVNNSNTRKNIREIVKTELVAAKAHMVEQLTQNPKFKGSNPAVPSGTGKE